jgi:hypothetical protein
MSSTADVTGGKPIAVWSQSVSDVRAINPLAAFYDIYGGKREVLFFYLYVLQNRLNAWKFAFARRRLIVRSETVVCEKPNHVKTPSVRRQLSYQQFTQRSPFEAPSETSWILFRNW